MFKNFGMFKNSRKGDNSFPDHKSIDLYTSAKYWYFLVQRAQALQAYFILYKQIKLEIKNDVLTGLLTMKNKQ